MVVLRRVPAFHAPLLYPIEGLHQHNPSHQRNFQSGIEHARLSDVLSLKWSQISEEGIFIQQGKTGTKQIKVWTERLHNAIELAKTLGGREIVISSSKKTKYLKSGFNDLW